MQTEGEDMERKGLVTFQGNPLTLIGTTLSPGDAAPSFTVLDKDLTPVTLGDFSGKVKIVSTTPSLDTPVCNLQATTFNREAQSLSTDIVIVNISMDLPFAIARFCSAEGIDRIRTLSDHRAATFGLGYGILVEELRLLARSIFVIDKSDVIRYIEIVPEMTNEPNYNKALEEAKKVV
jgi:thioredoxin-dependent peroxiredoxin